MIWCVRGLSSTAFILREVDRKQLKIRPVMSFKTRIVHVKTVKEACEISYGGRYTSAPGDQIGTIAVGYADGYTRAQSGRAEVLFRESG